jgi:hypothetical protein
MNKDAFLKSITGKYGVYCVCKIHQKIDDAWFLADYTAIKNRTTHILETVGKPPNDNDGKNGDICFEIQRGGNGILNRVNLINYFTPEVQVNVIDLLGYNDWYGNIPNDKISDMIYQENGVNKMCAFIPTPQFGIYILDMDCIKVVDNNTKKELTLYRRH